MKSETSNYDDDVPFFFVPTHADNQMLATLNGQERNVTQFRDLLDRAGWKTTAVHYSSLSTRRYQKVVAVPT